MLMKAMHLNSFPDDDSGLATVYDWSSDMCRRACGRSAEEFIKMSTIHQVGLTRSSCRRSGGPLQLVAELEHLVVFPYELVQILLRVPLLLFELLF